MVRHGGYREYCPNSGKIYCYSRSMTGQRIRVVCSLCDKRVDLWMPKGFDHTTGKVILQNDPSDEDNILEPNECRVYLWNE